MKTKIQLLTFFLIGCSAGWILSTIYFKESTGQLISNKMERAPRQDPFSELNLDSKILNKIRSIHDEGREDFRESQKNHRMQKDAYDKLIITTNDKAQLTEAFSKVIEAKAEIDWTHFKTMQAVHSLLTVEQIQQLRKRGPRRDDRRGPPPRRDGQRRPPHPRGNFPPNDQFKGGHGPE